MNAQHIVRLRAEERAELAQLLRRDDPSGFTHRRARMLLHADADGPGPFRTDRAIGAALAVSSRTVARVRAQFCAEGLAATLTRHPRPAAKPRRLDEDGERRLAALACSTPPEGHARWTLRLLANRAVELEIVPGISPETVRQTLKKTS